MRFLPKTKEAIYEIQNWLYVKKIIRKHRNTTDWQTFKLRADWIGRIYTVLNPELPGDKGDSKEVLALKYSERVKPINMYLDKIGLAQAVYPAYEDIQDSQSYLVVYSPIFNIITVWKIFVILVFTATFFITSLDSLTYRGIAYLYNNFFN